MPCNANSKALWRSLTAEVFLSVRSIMWSRFLSTTIARHSNGLAVEVGSNNSRSSQRPARSSCSNSACGEAILDQRNRNLYYYYIASQNRLMFKNSFGNQLQKRKELLYNLGAISSYTSMLIFLWHGIEMLVTKEQPKHTLLLYAGSSFFSILVMAPYKWDKKWMRIKTSVGMVVFGCSFIIYLICLWIN